MTILPPAAPRALPKRERAKDRIGLYCPMAGKATRNVEFARYPKYKALYIKSFDRMIEERKRRGKVCEWESGVDVFHWWLQDGVLSGQLEIEDLLEVEDEE